MPINYESTARGFLLKVAGEFQRADSANEPPRYDALSSELQVYFKQVAEAAVKDTEPDDGASDTAE